VIHARGALLTALACIVGFSSACVADASLPQSRLPEIEVCFITEQHAVPVTLEVAKTFQQRQAGLMARDSLAPNAGMLFRYPEPQEPDRGFWMYQTTLTLDIAYLNESGIIGSVRTMEPCASSRPSNCPSYPAGVVFSSAVEMSDGFFATNGIGVGDRMATGEECRR